MKIAQRLGYPAWLDDRIHQETMEFMKKYTDTVDEIAVFSRSGHNDRADALEELRRDLPKLRKGMQDFRDLGFKSVGVNVLVTIGHIDEVSGEGSLPFQKIVGYRGDTSYVCCCPNHEDFLQFTEEKYRLYAQAKPDFIWVDDDIKIFWNGVKFGCFCPECLRKFNEKYGCAYDRETLVREMEIPENTCLRAKWVQDVSDRITNLLARIKKAIREVDPDMPLGFMTQRPSWSTYNGMDFPAWFTALDAVKGRPGEGYYFDTVPDDVILKTLSTAQQAFEYPETVTDIQYELECFPTFTWQKSQRMKVTEVLLAIGQGMNGVLLNNEAASFKFDGLDGQYVLYREYRPVMEAYLDGVNGGRTGGFWPAFSCKYDQRRRLTDGDSFFMTLENTPKHDVTAAYAFAKMGIPMTMDRKGAWGAILTGELSQGFSDEELLEMLKGAVIITGDAVEPLLRRGFGKYIGVEPIGKGDLALRERYDLTEPVNFGMKTPYRDVRPAFFGGTAVYFKAVQPGVRVLSVIENHATGEDLGIGTSVFENELGGCICVMGYAPFLMANDVNRFVHLQGVAAWLLGEKQTAKLVTPGKTLLFVRENGKSVGLCVMQMTLDKGEGMEAAVRGAEKIFWLNGAEKVELACQKQDGWTVFTLPTLEPYTPVFLLAE